MIVFEELGNPLTHQILTPGDTITALNAEMYQYTERDLAFTSGGTTEIVPGDWIVGATSSAKAEVVKVTLSSGTWAGGDAVGTLRIRSQHGTFQSENLKVAAGTNDATIAADSIILRDGYDNYGRQAKAAMVTGEDNTALVSVTGGKPDQTAKIGHQIAPGSSWVLRSYDEIKNFRCVDLVSGSASVLQATFYY